MGPTQACDRPHFRETLVVDELQDLVAEREAAQEFFGGVKRLGAKARAAGVHMVLAAQRPDRSTVPPIVKANLRGKVALQVSSQTNSRIILDQSGAERLLGKGDPLADRGHGLVRAQAAWWRSANSDRQWATYASLRVPTSVEAGHMRVGAGESYVRARLIQHQSTSHRQGGHPPRPCDAQRPWAVGRPSRRYRLTALPARCKVWRMSSSGRGRAARPRASLARTWAARSMAVVVGMLAVAGCEAVAGIEDLQEGPAVGTDGSVGVDSPSYETDTGQQHDASKTADASRTDGDATVDADADASERDVADANSEDAAVDVLAEDRVGDGPADQDAGSAETSTPPDATTPDADAAADADSGPPTSIELIDDMESTGVPVGWIDGVNTANPRAGTWYVFDDGTAGGVLSPAPGTAASLIIAAIPGGRGTSVHSAHVTGNASFTTYGAGMGFNLNSPASPPGVYDASAYQGFTFWARSLGDAGNVTVRFNVLDRNTAPPGSGGVCDGGACNGYYGINLSVGAAWQQYVVSYSQLARPVFSVPDGENFDPAHMIGCQWQVNEGESFDLWVDDIYFIQ
jgi:hypothetical protein